MSENITRMRNRWHRQFLRSKPFYYNPFSILYTLKIMCLKIPMVGNCCMWLRISRPHGRKRDKDDQGLKHM